MKVLVLTLKTFIKSTLPFQPFSILEREGPVVEGPGEDSVVEGRVLLDREEGVEGGGVGGGQAGVEVDALHGEVAPGTVDQTPGGVDYLQDWA